MNCTTEPHYLPCIQYFTRVFFYDKILLDTESLFIKQTYRNRCLIMGANGIQPLIIPVKKGKTKQAMKDVLVDDEHPWQRQHLLALRSAYGKAPYYEYYIGKAEKIYKNKYRFLLDVNLAFTEMVCILLKISFAEKFMVVANSSGTDLRNSLSPKKETHPGNEDFYPAIYTQVFSDRYPFAPNLSVIDLLMNEGPFSVEILKSSIRQK